MLGPVTSVTDVPPPHATAPNAIKIDMAVVNVLEITAQDVQDFRQSTQYQLGEKSRPTKSPITGAPMLRSECHDPAFPGDQGGSATRG